VTESRIALRVAERTGQPPALVQQILDAAVEEMGWPEIEAYYAEFRKGQVYDDAGGYILRCIGRLFGARTRHDELENHRRSARGLIAVGKEPA